MALRLVVISPLSNVGATFASTVIAQAATYANKSSILLYTDPSSYLPKYLDLDSQVKDITKSVRQLKSLYENDQLRNEDILTYAVTYVQKASVLNLTDDSISTDGLEDIVAHVFSAVPCDVVVIDSSEDLDSKVSRDIIQNSDAVFIVSTPCHKSVVATREWSKYARELTDSLIIPVVNYYDESIISVEALAQKFNVKKSLICKLHYNPYVTQYMEQGKLQSVVSNAVGADPRFINLMNDVNEIRKLLISLDLDKTKVR